MSNFSIGLNNMYHVVLKDGSDHFRLHINYIKRRVLYLIYDIVDIKHSNLKFMDFS